MDRREFVTRSAAFSGYLSLPSRLRGSFSPRKLQLARAAAPGRSYDYELCYIPCYGQSLSLGAGGIPALSLHQRFDSLMFAGGTIAQAYSSDLSADYGSLIPLVENNNQPNFDTSLIVYPGESPLSGAFEAVKELMASQDGLSTSSVTYKLLGSCPGQSGVGIADLSRGTVPYERLLYEVQAAKSLAAQAGLTFGLPALFWLQGEADGCCLSQAQYFSYLQQLFQSLNSDVKAVTGQAKDVQFFSYQTATSKAFHIACAQYQLSTAMANVHVASPAYPLQTQGDGTHLTPLSYKVMGAYFGSAYKRVVVNGEAWLPLSPKTITASGAAIVIDFNIAGTALVADGSSITTTSLYRPAYGFFLADASGNSVDIAGQVEITGAAQITITSPEAVTTGFTVGYGMGGGNIRDTYGEQYVFNSGGLQQPMHNWLTVFEYTFPQSAVTPR
jgi:hypothetical protein